MANFFSSIKGKVTKYSFIRFEIALHCIDLICRATLVLGFLPQELLGTSMYEYYQYEDIPALAEAHKITLQSTEKVVTSVYRFRTKRNDFVCLKSVWKTFKNPWTKEIESMMAKNSVLL